MELPLELSTLPHRVVLDPTEDNSRTRLMLSLDRPDTRTGGYAELDVRDVQELAGALLQWLDENGHDLPALPADLGLDVNAKEGCVTGLVAPQNLGQLQVRQDGLQLYIEKADRWIACAPELWEQLGSPASTHATVDGDVLTITDTAGVTVRYQRCRDLVRPDGSLVLERTYPLSGLPEHTRPDSQEVSVAALTGQLPEHSRG